MVNKKLLQPTILSETLKRLDTTQSNADDQIYDEVNKESFSLDVSAGPNSKKRPRTPTRRSQSADPPKRKRKSPRSRTPRPRAHREKEYYVNDYNKPLPNTPRTPRTYENVNKVYSNLSLKSKTKREAKKHAEDFKLQLCKPLPIAIIIILFIIIIAISSGKDKVSQASPINDSEGSSSFFPKPSLIIQTQRCPGKSEI